MFKWLSIRLNTPRTLCVQFFRTFFISCFAIISPVWLLPSQHIFTIPVCLYVKANKRCKAIPTSIEE